jgi:single-strand DNA-binding protein
MQKNRIELAGYLAAKPEMRYVPSGTKVSNARLGETHRYRDHEGQSQSHTNWHNLTFYDDLAELALTYEQGENLFVEGTLQQRKFTPKDSVTRTVHEVIVRSCHLIAASRFRGESDAGPEAHPGGHESPAIDAAEGGPNDGSWPV